VTRLEIHEGFPGDIGFLVRGPFPQVRELVVEGRVDRIPSIIRACPNVTSLAVTRWGSSMGDADIDAIFATCSQLEDLTVTCRGGEVLALDQLSTAPCSRSIRRLRVSYADAAQIDHQRPCELVARFCPGICELVIHRLVLDVRDVRSLAQLKHLEALEVVVDSARERATEMLEAFASLGRAANAVPFTRLGVRGAAFNVAGFFTTSRCRGLQQAALLDCEGATRDSVLAMIGACPRLKQLKVPHALEAQLRPVVPSTLEMIH
jgi:hypothetical protein